MSARLAWTLRQTRSAFHYRRSGCCMTAAALENDLLEALRHGPRDEIQQIVPLLRGARWIENVAWKRELAAVNRDLAAAE